MTVETHLFRGGSLSRWVSISSLMTALALVGNYALVIVPNVELGSTVLFLTAYVFGLSMGLWCALLTSVIFAAINPWGGFIPEIWLAQLAGWTFMVLIGALLGRADGSEDKTSSTITFFVAGVVVTVFFDLVTNLGYSLAFGVPYVIALITGAPFMAVHVLSNGILFSLTIPQLHSIISTESLASSWNAENEYIEVDSED